MNLLSAAISSQDILEDFPLPKFLNLALLVLNPKLCLVVKIDDSQVPTTKQSLEIRFSLSKLGIPDQREVEDFLSLLQPLQSQI